MNLLGQIGNFRSNKVLTVSALSGQEVKLSVVTNPKDKEFLSKSPLGKCPALETTQGVITQSNSIIRYLANLSQKLYGSNDFERG